MRGSAGLLALMGLALVALLEPGCGGRVSRGSSDDLDATGSEESADGSGGGSVASQSTRDVTSGTAGSGGSQSTGVAGALVATGGAGTSTGGVDESNPECLRPGLSAADGVCRGIPFEPENLAGAANDFCAGTALESEALPQNLLLLVDRSVSMLRALSGGDAPAEPGETRWDAVQQGVQAFLELPRARGVGLGLQFFGYDDSGTDELNCSAANYSVPTIPASVEADDHTRISNELEAMTGRLGGSTPTLPALQGILDYAPQAANETSRVTRVVLLTGGLPNQCQSSTSIEAVAAEAERGVEEEGVLTHIVGVGAGLGDLHQIARDGGTCEAYLVESGDAAAQVSEALGNISLFLHTGFPCEFEIPFPLDPTQELDLDRVEVLVQSITGFPEWIPQVPTEELCGASPNGGWYYDDNGDPERVHLCPCLCNRVDSSRIELRFGCLPRSGLE